MKSHDRDEPSPPIEAYYAAPKHRLEKLFDTSELGLRKKTSRILWLLCFLHLLLNVIETFWIKHNPFMDGALVICTWIILVTLIWSHPREVEWDELAPIWRKRLYLFLVILVGFASIMMPIMWTVEYVFKLTSFDF